jgi:hypothetical protein
LKKGFPYLVLATPLFLGQFGFGLTGFSSLKPTGLVFLAYSPYWFQYYRGNNWTHIAKDLELIKMMGFDGVRIHYEYVVNLGLVEPLLDYTQRLGLKVIWATHATYWNVKFPTRIFQTRLLCKAIRQSFKL